MNTLTLLLLFLLPYSDATLNARQARDHLDHRRLSRSHSSRCYSSDCHGNKRLKTMSRARQISVYDKALQIVLRNKPLSSLNQLLCRRSSVTALDLYQNRIFENPPNKTGRHNFGFLPVMPTKMLRSIVDEMAREERMKRALCTVASCEDQMRGRERVENGYVFEEFHAQWYLAMKSHQTRQSFLKDPQLPWDDANVRLAQEDLLQNRFSAPAFKHLEDALPHCHLTDLYNGASPLSSMPISPNHLLLFGRYSIEEPRGETSEYLLGRNALDIIPEDQLQELLLGRILLRNVPCGAGYDYLEVNWHLQNSHRPLLTFDFIEMKYSAPTSISTLTHEEVVQKYKWVRMAFKRFVQQRIPSRIGVDLDFRLIVCSWRPCKRDFPIELLPPRVLVYPLDQLAHAYGPSLTSQGPFSPRTANFAIKPIKKK